MKTRPIERHPILLKKRRKITLFFVAAVFVFVVYPLWFGYFYNPFKKSNSVDKDDESDAHCDDIPTGSIAFALGFEHLGEDNGVIRPGQANEYLAAWIEEHTDRFTLVLTQKSISDALRSSDMLKNKIPVYQMHRHDSNMSVRTLDALRCALDRLNTPPKSVVLIAHDKHYERAFNDLHSICPGCVLVNPCIIGVPYKDNFFLNPFLWALRELYIARPIDFLRRNMGEIHCLDAIRLEKIEESI